MRVCIEQLMRILLLNLGAESLEAANGALANQGYDVANGDGLTIDEILAMSPEVLVTEATPSDLSSCALIGQLKARPQTNSSLKIVLIVHGGAIERAGGLELGADDVISFPFEPVEFAARARTQFRELHPRGKSVRMPKSVVLQKQFIDAAMESRSGLVATRRLWLIPAIFALSTAAAFATVYLGIASRGTRKETRQMRAEIARLSNGLGEKSEVQRRGEATPGRSDITQSHSASVRRDAQKAQSGEQGKRGAAGGSDVDSLKRQLGDTQNRLKLLENESNIAQTVIHEYGSSVCLLHVVVEFLDQQTGRPIRIAVDDAGKPLVEDKSTLELVEGGFGPPLRVDVFGTGFLVSREGKILSNHHVVEPWWKAEELKQLLDRGAKPFVLDYEVYFPGRAEGLRAKLDRISTHADVATLQLESPLPANSAVLELDDRNEAAVTGDPVVLIGYPTGIEGILARAGTDVTQEITGGPQDVTRMMSQIASQRLVRPTTTQGHIGDVLEDEIVYDAATTSGGSGGPLFNRSGKVIGINFAVLRDFGGSNLAVPVKYAKELLK